MDDVYAPQDRMIALLDKALKKRFELREIFSDSDVADKDEKTIPAESIVVIPEPFLIIDIDAEEGDTFIETRWRVTTVKRSYNEKGRAVRARKEAGKIVIAIIQHLSAWEPAPGFGPLLLRRWNPPKHAAQKIFIPLVFGSSTTIEKNNT